MRTEQRTAPPRGARIRRLAVSAALLAFSAAAPALAGPEPAADVKTETVEYGGWGRNLKLSNGQVELIVTLDVGPRIISYRRLDGENVFKNYDDQLGKSGEPGWMIRGGHRLWTSPEDLTRTYAPDNAPVKVENLGPGHVRLTPADDPFGVRKQIDLKLEPEGSRVTLVHRLINVGDEPTVAAPWALSVMKGGGVEIIPLPARKPHPGGSENAATAEDFAPNHAVVTWPYFQWTDDRFRFGAKYITLTHKDRGATKIGLVHAEGWIGYLNDGTLFVKRFDRQKGKTYPDLGVNYETFSKEDMVELESLGPLVRLAPGEEIEHVETWDLHGGLDEARTEEEIDRVVLPAVRGR